MTIPAGGDASWAAGHMTERQDRDLGRCGGPACGDALDLWLFGQGAASAGAYWRTPVTTSLQRHSHSSGTGAVIENSGTFDIRDDGDLTINYGGTRTRFENTGTLKKTSGTASTDIGATVGNTGGTVDVTSGTLNLAGGLDNFSSTGGVRQACRRNLYNPEPQSVLKFTGADIDVNAATIVLDGLGSAILDQNNSDAIDNLSDNDGSFTIRSDRDLRTAGALTNEGSVTIGTDSVLTTTGESSRRPVPQCLRIRRANSRPPEPGYGCRTARLRGWARLSPPWRRPVDAWPPASRAVS